MVNKDVHYSSSSARQQELTEWVVDLIADSMLPLQLVEGRGFRKFVTRGSDVRYA